MTASWQQALGASGLPKKKETLDKGAYKMGDIWRSVSFVDVYIDVCEIIEMHTRPLIIKDIVDVEYEFNVDLYGESFRGFLDLVARTIDGKLVIIDWKTNSRTHKDSYKVAHHPQLLLYGWVYEHLTGQRPDAIGLGFLRANDVVIADYDPDLAEETMVLPASSSTASARTYSRWPARCSSTARATTAKIVCPYL
jgi:hypothetical protein